MAHNPGWTTRIGLGEQLAPPRPSGRFFSLAGRLTRSARRSPCTPHWPWRNQFGNGEARPANGTQPSAACAGAKEPPRLARRRRCGPSTSPWRGYHVTLDQGHAVSSRLLSSLASSGWPDPFGGFGLKRCRYCIVFASAEYAAKMWPNLERRSAQARDIAGAGGYILPVRFDDTEIPGLLPTVYYQDARKKSPEQIAGLFAQKIGQATPARIEFAILSTGARFDPLTLKTPGYNKMWLQERASLLTTVKVVFDAGERPCAQLTIVARDPGGNSVGEYSGWFTDSGIYDTVAGLPDPLAEKKAFVNSLLMGERFLFGEVGTYTVSWYLNGALHSTTLMEVYLPEDSS